MLHEISFNAETHQYMVQGVGLVPSVTQILQAVGVVDLSGIPPEALEKARMFGSVVHKYTELADLGKLDTVEMQPEVIPCLMAWERFKDENKVKVLEIEKAYYSTFGYCGTIDRLVEIDGVQTVVDIKTSSSVNKTAALQLAAYAVMIEQNTGKQPDRLIVHLTPDGDYKLLNGHKNGRQRKAFMDASDFLMWEKVLDVYFFNRKRGDK